MSVDLAYDLWNELKRFIGGADRAEAADSMVNLLIDNDFDADDIRSAFKGDAEVKRAVEVYLDDRAVVDDEEYDDEYDDVDDEDEDY
jgi:hypothetical protein